MPNKTTFLSASAILMSILVSSVLLFGYKEEEKRENVDVKKTEIVARPMFQEKKKEEDLPEIKKEDEEREEKTLSDEDATKIAEQLSIMWGPQEEKKTSSSSSYKTNGGTLENPDWPEITEEERKALEKAQQDAQENNEKTEEKDEKEKIPEEENEEKIDEGEDETEETKIEEEDTKETIENPEKEMSREQLILDIVTTINKYTSEKSQQRYLKETLNLLKGYEDEIGLLLDIKSFLPENLHTDINTRIAEIIAQEREGK